jgi:hypothetical protein
LSLKATEIIAWDKASRASGVPGIFALNYKAVLTCRPYKSSTEKISRLENLHGATFALE